MTTLRHIILATVTATAALTNHAQNILQMRDTITDPSFVYPESYEADTHRMIQDWYLNTYTSLNQPDSSSGNVTATDNEIIDRLKSMHTVVEMPYNSIVRGCINMYVDRRRGQVERMLGLSSYYMPIFEEALEAEGVPLELRYLPIIESALDPNAVSRAGATGLWQFMAPTARGLGMEITSLVDERRDPVRSSRMAARYLRQLHDIYDDWSLAIAAYNCGPGNVNKALKRAGEGKKDFWEIYPYLPAETRGYLPGFIAANYAMTYYANHGISPVLARRPIITDSIHVTQRVHFQQIADVLGMPIDEIRLLNPQYRQDIIPGESNRPYPLILPSQQTLAYIMSEDSIVSHNAHLYAQRGVVEPADGSSHISDDGNYIIKEVVKYHKVKKGDTFTSLAKRYGVTASSIKRTNGIKTLRRGRTIKIVTTQRVPRPAEASPADTTSVVPEGMQIDVTEETIPVTFDNEAGTDSPDTSDASEEPDSDVNADDADTSDDIDSPDSPSVIEPAATQSANEATHAATGTSAATDRIRSTFSSRPAPQNPESESSDKLGESTIQVNSEPAPKAEPAKPKTTEPNPVYVKVKKGETLSKIARANHTTVNKIQKLNPKINPSKIKPGDRIRVK